MLAVEYDANNIGRIHSSTPSTSSDWNMSPRRLDPYQGGVEAPAPRRPSPRSARLRRADDALMTR